MSHSQEPRPFRFTRSMRLSTSHDFDAVFRDGLRRSRGPLVVFMRPNPFAQHRLGLSVGRRVGGAVVRNRVKRRVREAFRTLRPSLPHAYDIVVKVRPHEPLSAADYESHLRACAEALAKEWARRARRTEGDDAA